MYRSAEKSPEFAGTDANAQMVTAWAATGRPYKGNGRFQHRTSGMGCRERPVCRSAEKSPEFAGTHANPQHGTARAARGRPYKEIEASFPTNVNGPKPYT